MTLLHDSLGNSIKEFPTDEDGNEAMPVMFRHNGQHIHLDANNVASTTPFILISLRDTGKWKHTNTNTIHINWMGININPSSSYRGDISIGFLTGTTATTGSFRILKTYHLDQAANAIQAFLSFGDSHMECSTAHWFGPTTANDSTWGHSRQLLGPDNYLHFGTYDGDMVMKVWVTAGNVDVGVTVGYHTD